ncbi:MAG: hypothetical protein ABH879_05620 [archaeon]
MLFSFQELIDLVVMTAFIGFIFKDVFRKHINVDMLNPYNYYSSMNLENFKFAVLVTAPAIILHEMSHKFVAIAMGLSATFHAAYTWLGIGLLLKMMNFGFIFFIPGYVSYPAAGTALQHALISFAGPGMNLFIWLLTSFAIRQRLIPRKYLEAALLTKRINMFLFIFNMIPISPFDGGHFFSNIFRVLFG